MWFYLEISEDDQVFEYQKDSFREGIYVVRKILVSFNIISKTKNSAFFLHQEERGVDRRLVKATNKAVLWM